jgi:hypothetical protein
MWRPESKLRDSVGIAINRCYITLLEIIIIIIIIIIKILLPHMEHGESVKRRFTSVS